MVGSSGTWLSAAAPVAWRSTSSKPSSVEIDLDRRALRAAERELQPAVLAGAARRVIGELQAADLLPRQAPPDRAAQRDAARRQLDPAQLAQHGAHAEPGEQQGERAEQHRHHVREVERQQRPGGHREAAGDPQVVRHQRGRRVVVPCHRWSARARCAAASDTAAAGRGLSTGFAAERERPGAAPFVRPRARPRRGPGSSRATLARTRRDREDFRARHVIR